MPDPQQTPFDRATLDTAELASQIRSGVLLEDLTTEAVSFEVLSEQLERDGWNPDTGYEHVSATATCEGTIPLADWVDRALCAEIGGDVCFADSTTGANRPCHACEVRDECLEYALANDERHGIWGDLSRSERERLQQERAEAA